MKKPVVCWETGQVFESVVAASRTAGVGAASIRGAAKTGKRAGCFHWRYADDPFNRPFLM